MQKLLISALAVTFTSACPRNQRREWMAQNLAPNDCFLDEQALTHIENENLFPDLDIHYDKLSPYDDECLLYEEMEYSGDILSIELGEMSYLNIWKADQIEELKKFTGSVKCGKDIEFLEMVFQINDSNQQSHNYFEGDWSFSNPVVSEDENLKRIFIDTASWSPESYVVYDDQNCEGQFFSQWTSVDGLNIEKFDHTIKSIHTSMEYHVKVMEAPSSIEIDGNYYILQAKDLSDQPQSFFTAGHQFFEIIAQDSENFKNVLYTVPSNTCFNLSDLPTTKPHSELYYYICKDECNVDHGECCIAYDDFDRMNTDEFTVEQISCIGNTEDEFDELCKQQQLRLE